MRSDIDGSAVPSAAPVSRFAGTLMDILDRVEYSRVRMDVTDNPIYRLRYEAYRREESVPFNDAGVVVRSSVELAQRLRLQTVGEGIEGLYDWQLLQSLGVNRGQGFYIARPMPATEFPKWLSLWEARRYTQLRESVDSIPTASA